ncbi:MAG TPA: transporter [Gemmatimonadaceae bacterium]|nr:transporter [Gemmatimonadaceae bacterium]
MPPLRSRPLLLLVASLLLAGPVHAQDAGAEATMRERLRNVFHFGSCEELICLSLESPGEHGQHYNPAAREVAESVVGFLYNAIQTSVANIPIGATSSGTIFEIGPTGMPVPVASSTGPIFGERSQTLGRGRLLVGVNATGASFRSIRGIDLDDLSLTLSHQDVPPSGEGNPGFERDTIHVQTALEASMSAMSVYLTYGLTNRIDIGVVVPVVHLSIDGTSIGTIVNTGSFPLHFWSGTSADPQFVDTTQSSGSTTGLGDIAARVKFNLAQSPRGGLAFLTDVRLPTGDEEELLGSGTVAVRGLLVASARVGNMTPHANAGFLWREGEDENSALLGTIGFDALAAPHLTLAADLVGQYQLGESHVTLPPPTRFLDGSVVRATNIPSQRDHLLAASVGSKLELPGSFLAVANVILPLGENGMRPNLYWTVGLERGF